jgi:fused signal recognition particle receptor
MLNKWFGKKDKEAQEPKEAPPPSAPADAGAAEAPQAPKKSRWAFLRAGIQKTRDRLKSIFGLRGKLDDQAIEDIESALYGADFGPRMVAELIDGPVGLREEWKAGRIQQQEEVLECLKRRLKEQLKKRPPDLQRAGKPPTVYLIAGVNGSGKTTSIAKLAHRLQREGSSVMLVAADTFRAAAVEQLTIWSQRLGIPIVTGKPGADPASVAFAGVQRAIDEGLDYAIVDTAGRLHTDQNLMRELKKIRAVIEKKLPGAPHESLLVLDATNGQNAIQQANAFKRDIEVSGIILTKLDGTAKGGVVFTIHQELEIPVKLVGIGEKPGDMTGFDPDQFVDAIFDSSE